MNGNPTKNPRYLQTRPDLVDPMAAYVAERGVRLFRAIPDGKPVHLPVNAVIIGRHSVAPTELDSGGIL